MLTKCKKKKDSFQNSAKDKMTHFKILFSQKITEIVMVGKNFSQVKQKKTLVKVISISQIVNISKSSVDTIEKLEWIEKVMLYIISQG